MYKRQVSNRDLAGRKAVLAVHAKGKPIAADADLDGLAKRTVGMLSLIHISEPTRPY